MRVAVQFPVEAPVGFAFARGAVVVVDCAAVRAGAGVGVEAQGALGVVVRAVGVQQAAFGDEAAGADVERQVFERGGNMQGLAAAVVLPTVIVVPAAVVIRQVHVAFAHAFCGDGADEDVAADHVVVGVGVGARVVFVVEEGRAEVGFAVFAGLPEQGVEVRDEAVALFDGLAHGVGNAWVHPWFVGAAVVVPAVDGEAR